MFRISKSYILSVLKGEIISKTVMGHAFGSELKNSSETLN